MRASKFAITAAFAVALPVLAGASRADAEVIFSASGASPIAIEGQVNAFRATLGTLNPNVAGSFGSGRREINWDGVPDALSAPNNLPSNFFNTNSPRGAEFSTPGTGFQVSANVVNPTSTPIEFGHINPAYPGLFQPFSPQRLFTALGSNVLDVNFFVPGSSTAAFTRGFGSVFTDVDLANITSLTFFGANNLFLGTYFVPSVPGTNESLSFLGVDFGAALVSRVRIVSGNAPLSGFFEGAGIDLVVMDDFLYGEPIAATAVPEPASLVLFGMGLLGLGLTRRLCRRA